MDIKALNKILHNGKLFGAGDIVTGLSTEEGERLIKLKDGIAYGDSPNLVVETDEEALTVDEFKKLSAAEQKHELELIGIEPASNEAERVEQYTGWYESPEE